MKKKICCLKVLFIIAIITMIGLVGPLAYAEESLVNPSEFGKWEVVDSFPCPGGYLDTHYILENPDASAVISQVETITLNEEIAKTLGKECLYIVELKNRDKVHISYYMYEHNGEIHYFDYDCSSKQWIFSK